MEHGNNKTSRVLGDVIRKAKAVRQVGDVHHKDSSLVWTEYKPGKFDWRNSGKGSATAKKTQEASGKYAKLAKTLPGIDSDKLVAFATKPGNDAQLRQMAYDELVSRGEDVSGIDMNTGKLGRANQMAKVLGPNQKSDDILYSDGAKSDSIDDILEDDEEENEWMNPDYINKRFGGLKTKRQRIAADKFIHDKKIKQKGYKPPHEEIENLNRAYANWISTDSPLMIASGGAGVGKTYNFHAVAEYMGKRPFDPNMDEADDQDYDYVEVGEVKSATNLANLLHKHNGKTILFDDTDNILGEPDPIGILKKATASSGKRIVGYTSTQKSSNVDPFEFTGKIIFLTNKSQAELTKNEHLKAVYSRAVKTDIQFTKREQLSFMERLKDFFEFTGIERLDDKAEDQKERDDIFDIIERNIEEIDPAKFNARSMMDALQKKREIDKSNELLNSSGGQQNAKARSLFGTPPDWKEEVEVMLTKGSRQVAPVDQDEINKASSILKL